MTELKITTFDVLGVQVSATNLSSASARIFELVRDSARTYICIAPVSTIMDCQRSEEYRQVVNNAGMVTPDGMPLVWLGRRAGLTVGRTYGPDLLEAMCEQSTHGECSHFFYGGTAAGNHRLMDFLKQKYSGLDIRGSYAPPFRRMGEKEEDGVLRMINETKADILWVGLGSPKQDFWMKDHREALDVPVIIGVGAAFDFLAGLKPQAPRWMQRSGLEWLFRLGCEPRRLWKRYLVGNTMFIYLLIKTTIRNILGNHGTK